MSIELIPALKTEDRRSLQVINRMQASDLRVMREWMVLTTSASGSLVTNCTEWALSNNPSVTGKIALDNISRATVLRDLNGFEVRFYSVAKFPFVKCAGWWIVAGTSRRSSSPYSACQEFDTQPESRVSAYVNQTIPAGPNSLARPLLWYTWSQTNMQTK